MRVFKHGRKTKETLSEWSDVKRLNLPSLVLKEAMNQGTQGAVIAREMKKTDLISHIDSPEKNAALPTPPF